MGRELTEQERYGAWTCAYLIQFLDKLDLKSVNRRRLAMHWINFVMRRHDKDTR
jgi:hypothetical protein